LAPLPGKAPVKIIDKVVDQILNWCSLFKHANLALFSPCVKIGLCMTDFDLPQNFTQGLESLLRRVRPRVITPQISLSAVEIVIIAPSTSNAMAQKTLREFSASSADNVPIRPSVNTGAENFQIKTGLITMVQASPFYGKANEDASTHLQQFLELCSTFVIKVSHSRCNPTPFISIFPSREGKIVVFVDTSAVDSWENAPRHS
jgi:hypothetical protein